MGQADADDNEAKLMRKLAPEWVRTIDTVIRSPARYRWTTAPANTAHQATDPACLYQLLPVLKTRNSVDNASVHVNRQVMNLMRNLK